MESVKKSVKNFGKGFGIWLILLLLNTRDGESSVNGIKIIMDTLLSIILIGNNKKAREAALGISALTVVVTCLKLPGDVEMLLLIGIAVLGVMVLKNIPDMEETSEAQNDYSASSYETDDELPWNTRNVFWPFEKYSFSPDQGICIQKGVIKRTYMKIKTKNIQIRINQTIMQRIFRICDISFLSDYTGFEYGSEVLRNVRLKYAMELSQMV